MGQTRDGRELVGGARDEAREATLRRGFFCSHSLCCCYTVGGIRVLVKPERRKEMTSARSCTASGLRTPQTFKTLNPQQPCLRTVTSDLETSSSPTDISCHKTRSHREIVCIFSRSFWRKFEKGHARNISRMTRLALP